MERASEKEALVMWTVESPSPSLSPVSSFSSICLPLFPLLSLSLSICRPTKSGRITDFQQLAAAAAAALTELSSVAAAAACTSFLEADNHSQFATAAIKAIKRGRRKREGGAVGWLVSLFSFLEHSPLFGRVTRHHLTRNCPRSAGFPTQILMCGVTLCRVSIALRSNCDVGINMTFEVSVESCKVPLLPP